MVLFRATIVVGVGLALGLAGAWALARWVNVKTFLFKVELSDPLVYGGVALVLAGLVAALVPAWRAARVDPAITLRSD